VRNGIVRRESETWRECAIRYAKPQNLEAQIERQFDLLIAAGECEEAAAFLACESHGLGESVSAPYDMPEKPTVAVPSVQMPRTFATWVQTDD
jgi:hypothetical protein